MVRIGAYVLSEYGELITEAEDKSTSAQFELLHSHFYQSSNATKAMLLTSYMKMLKNCPALTEKIYGVLMSYQEHWDEELQQRACEYIEMLKQSRDSQAMQSMCMNALGQMPNFSEELQTNNVLTRRILELKVKKGFAINQEEAEKRMRADMKKYTTNVSSALV